MNSYHTQTKHIYADQAENTKDIFITFEDWGALWNYILIDLKFKKTMCNMNGYKSRFRVMCRYFKDIPFNRKNYNAFIAHLEAQDQKNNSLNKFVSFGKIVDKYYGLNQLLDYTYFKREEKQMVETLTPDEIIRLAEVKIDYVKEYIDINKRDKALIYLLATTGCRLGEAIDLKWSDLYGEPRTVQFRETKNGSNRLVPISEQLYQMLMQLTPWSNVYIFASFKGHQLDSSSFGVILSKRAKRAGVNKRVWPHLFRHSFITELIKAGVSVIHIARIVGHKDLATTDGYAALVVDDLAEVINYHPLLRKGISFEALSKKMKLVLQQSTDKEKYQTTVTESPSELTISIKKL